MKLTEARDILQYVEGRSRWWMEEWGKSTIKEAVWTIRNRHSATQSDLEMAERVSLEINYGRK